MGAGRGKVDLLQGYRPRSTVLVLGDGLRPMDKVVALEASVKTKGRDREER